MLTKSIAAVALSGLFAAATFVGGAFGSSQPASPCACCEVCVCEDCGCDELGCACDTGGECACDEACHGACCEK